jgi:hypothetical protein
MKKSLLFLFLLSLASLAQPHEKMTSLSAELIATIGQKQQYVMQKEARITNIRKLIAGNTSLTQQYSLTRSIISEYKKFRLDSAIWYAQKSLNIAKKLNSKDLEQESLLLLSTFYSSSGKSRESDEIIKSIGSKHLSNAIRPLFYNARIDFFEHYNTNSYSQVYFDECQAYRDSLLAIIDPSTMDYQINLAEKNINRGKPEIADKDLRILLKTATKDTPDYAMIAYLLGSIHDKQGNTDLAEKYYTISAISDIKNAIKDHASILSLASLYYKRGDIDNAYKFTKSAIEDALFCKVQFRTLQISELFSIINIAYQNKETKQKSQLQLYLLLISILSVFLVLAVLYVYKQMKKVSKIKGELSLANDRLCLANEKLVDLNNNISETNEQLQERNVQLSDSNLIKEEYIAHFFDLCSTYINKLENYRKTLNKKANEKQIDELFKMLKSTTLVDDELEELYQNFDNIFINLYPTFVRDFNALLIKEEQVVLKPGEILNTELRIFALVRLGITDSIKIAAFLRYSLSTIYNYRTKTRNKAAVSRDQFEEMVMKIGTIPGKSSL